MCVCVATQILRGIKSSERKSIVSGWHILRVCSHIVQEGHLGRKFVDYFRGKCLVQETTVFLLYLPFVFSWIHVQDECFEVFGVWNLIIYFFLSERGNRNTNLRFATKGANRIKPHWLLLHTHTHTLAVVDAMAPKKLRPPQFTGDLASCAPKKQISG